MKKTIIGTALASMLVVGLVGSASAGKPVEVWTDNAGDAGNHDQGVVGPGFDQAGFDLVSGSINKVGKNLEFVTTVAGMPTTGSLPEGARMMWHFGVGTEQYRFTIKSQDVGKPDVIGQSGQERLGQVYANGVFRLEQCSEDTTLPLTLVQCKVLEYLDGKFDPATKTITAVLPLASVKAKAGTLISGGTGGAADTACQVCWVPHYAERSLTSTTVIDSATVAASYKVPKK